MERYNYLNVITKKVSQRVPEDSLNHHHHHEHGKRQGRQKVPLFVESDKNVPHFVEGSEKGVPRFEENVNKANPFIRHIGHSEKQGRHMRHFSNVIPTQRSKMRERAAKKKRKREREKKRPGSRNRFNSKAGKKSQEESIPRQEDLKGLVQRVGAPSGGRREDILSKKGGRRRKKQVAAPLSAGDLWSLNRFALHCIASAFV